MDIDWTLEELREMISLLENPDADLETLRTAADATVDLFRALDNWITRYGYLPMPWRQK